MDYTLDTPNFLSEFLSYHESIKTHSALTVDEYYLDLRNFLRYAKRRHGLVKADTPLHLVDISDLTLDFVETISLSEIYDYLAYLAREKRLSGTSRARKVSSIRSFYKYFSNKTHQLHVNPAQELDSPRIAKTLPRYLTLDESIQLLESVDQPNQARDYCILMLFLNCGLRISELVGLNTFDLKPDSIRVVGKGNKERILYLNNSCKMALDSYLTERSTMNLIDNQALFVTSRRTRITRAGVHKMVKKRLLQAGLDPTRYSSHKLRHTAATLMLQNGVDVRTLQEVLGHESLGTTQIYTHIDNESLRIAAQANPLANFRTGKGKK